MYNMGITDTNRLARLWYESSRKGFDNYSQYVDVRWNVVLAARELGFTQNEMRIIHDAFDAVNIAGPSISGRVIEATMINADGSFHYVPGQVNQPVRVTITDPNGFEAHTMTDAAGRYSFSSLNYGSLNRGRTYTLTFEHPRFETEARTVLLLNHNRTDVNVVMRPRQGTTAVTFNLYHNDTYHGGMERADTWQITAAIGSEVRGESPGSAWTVWPDPLRVSALGSNIITIEGDFS